MFSGIVERPCLVLALDDRGGARRLQLDLAPLREAGGPAPGEALVGLGDSVAVNGVCLTVTALQGDRASFDVIPESLQRTNLGGLQAGSRVNVERSLRFGDRVDGHLVQGHVETTGVVARADQQPGQTWLAVSCGPEITRRTLHKGSITIDGVSLTVAALEDEELAVALVPHTLECTTLGERRPGDRVNLEPDMLGQWVMKAVDQLQG